jgi:hypothetical protein
LHFPCNPADHRHHGRSRSLEREAVHRHVRQLAFAKPYDLKMALTAADLLNDGVVPFFDAQEVKLTRMLKDRTEYAATRKLYLAVKDVDHSRTKARNPQTNGTASAPTRRSSTSSTAQRGEGPSGSMVLRQADLP